AFARVVLARALSPRVARGGGGLALQVREVLEGVEQSVNVVNAQARDEAAAQEAEGDFVDGVEDGALLDAHGGEVVHVEEASVVYLVRCDAPEAEAVGLLADELFEQVETLGPTLHAVDALQSVVDCGAHLVALFDEG